MLIVVSVAFAVVGLSAQLSVEMEAVYALGLV